MNENSKYNYILLISLAFIIACCTTKKRKVLEVEKTGEFIVQKNSGNGPFFPQYLEKEDGMYLIVLNKLKKQINSYKLVRDDTAAASKVIDLRSAILPNEEVIDTYYHNEDSIFIQLSNNKLVLINQNGIKKKIWIISKTFPNGIKGELITYPWSKLKFHNNILYSSFFPSGLILGTSSEEFKRPSIAVIPLSNQDTLAVSESIVEFPEIYLKEFYYSFDPITVINADGELISSFFIDDNLYTSKKGQTLKKEQLSRLGKLLPFPKDSLRNYRYIGKYGTEQPQYAAFS